jgi:Fe-S cluster assembly ATPase SufC
MSPLFLSRNVKGFRAVKKTKRNFTNDLIRLRVNIDETDSGLDIDALKNNFKWN